VTPLEPYCIRCFGDVIFRIMNKFSLYDRDVSPVAEIRTFEVAVQLPWSTPTQDGRNVITNFCVTDKEVDFEIDLLIESLEKVRRDAKAKLAQNGPA